MIKKETKVIEAECDGCGNNLIDPTEPRNVNYAALDFNFGFGSDLDNLDDLSGDGRQFHFCEACTLLALAAVGLERKLCNGMYSIEKKAASETKS